MKLSFTSGVGKFHDVRVRNYLTVIQFNSLIVQIGKFRSREEKEMPLKITKQVSSEAGI